MVHDPASGERSFPITEASKHLTGVALELSPAEGFLPKDERARLPFSTFWTQLRGSTHALVQILILSVVLEAFVIASPFYLQLTVDEVIARGDADLLIVLALGFGLLTADQGCLDCYPLIDPRDCAECLALSNRRPSVPPSDPAAD